MLKKARFIFAGIAFAFVFASCSKEKKDVIIPEKDNNRIASNERSPDYCVEKIDIDANSAEESTPTVLGTPLIGQPFSVANMKQASINLYGHSIGITVTHKYVRFKPANDEQLQLLAESEDLDVFDYPLDSDVLIEGDYYPQPGIGENDYPWLYAVVPVVFNYPNVSYEVLQELHLPIDLGLEAEALRITGNLTNDNCGISRIEGPLVEPCDPVTGIGCGGGNPGPVTVPNKVPAGYIKVQDTELGEDQPVPNVAIVARRWFKVDRTKTDKTGYFYCTKSFRNKVNILVKFTGSNVTVKAVKGLRFWQLWFPLKTSIGKYSGRLNNLSYTFTDDGQAKTNRHKLWVAGTAVASFADFNKLVWQESIGEAPTGLHILLTTFGQGGSAPMNRHRNNVGAIPREFVNYFVANPGVSFVGQLVNYLYNTKLVAATDVTISYAIPGLPSSRLRAGIYHELAHASHFAKVGQAWWNSFIYSTASEIGRNIGKPTSPYGDGKQGEVSDYIGLAESWAGYVGEYLTARQYGRQAVWAQVQGVTYVHDSPTFGLSAGFNALENFNPRYAEDQFRWVSTGVYFDLLDYLNESVPVRDNVQGYTNSNFYNALTADVRSITAFRDKLLQNSGNWQQAEVVNLFNQYAQ